MGNSHISIRTSFLTSILTAWDGTETRHSLRRVPRRYMSYDYTGMDATQSEYLRALRYLSPNTVVRFPLWHAAEPLRDKIFEGALSVPIPSYCQWSYKGLGGVLFWVGDLKGGRVYDIKRVSASAGLALKEPTPQGQNWDAISTVLVPVARVILSDRATYTGRNDDVTETTAELELAPDQKGATVFPAQYDYLVDEPVPIEWDYRYGLPKYVDGVEVWRYEPQWEDNLDANLDKQSNRIDYDTGVFRYDTKNPSPAETRELTYVLHSKQQINNIERFFYRHKGAWKSFYAPSWLRDFELYEDAYAGSTELHVKMQYYWRYYNKTTRRHKVVVFFKDGTCTFIDITNYSRTADNAYGVVFLENALEQPLLRDQITMICFFNRYRFDTDDMTIDFETSDTATCSITLREVDE